MTFRERRSFTRMKLASWMLRHVFRFHNFMLVGLRTQPGPQCALLASDSLEAWMQIMDSGTAELTRILEHSPPGRRRAHRAGALR